MKAWRPFLVLLALAALPAILILGQGGVAATPAVFDSGLTLRAAMEKSRQSGTPVVAFATADWCSPCQAMKRETLVDGRVSAFLRSRTIPVYVNIDHDPDAAGVLQVTGIPATVVIAGDTIVSRSSGYLTPINYLSFLESSVDLAKSPEELEKLKAEPR